MDLIRVGEGQLGLAVAELLGGGDAQLVEGGADLLDDVVVSILAVARLELDDLQDPGGERVVVDPAASLEGGGHDGGLGDDIHG